MLSELLERGLCFDALKLGELATFEIISRKYQLWEEYYKDVLRERNSGVDSSASLDADERAIFLGRPQNRGTALVSPDLEQFVADKLRDRAAILKERRKAKEERSYQQETRSRQQQPQKPQGSKKQKGDGKGKSGGE